MNTGTPIAVRREEPSDRAAVSAVHRAAFATTDGREPAEVALVDALRTDAGWVPELSLVAVAAGDGGDAVVGHVCLTRGDLAGHGVLGLGPIGVAPAWQGRGAGSALMYAALGACEALGEPAVVLLGDEGFYRRFGFRAARRVGIAAPDPAWGDHFQARTFGAWRPGMAGTYRYAAPFAALG